MRCLRYSNVWIWAWFSGLTPRCQGLTSSRSTAITLVLSTLTSTTPPRAGNPLVSPRPPKFTAPPNQHTPILVNRQAQRPQRRLRSAHRCRNPSQYVWTEPQSVKENRQVFDISPAYRLQSRLAPGSTASGVRVDNNHYAQHRIVWLPALIDYMYKRAEQLSAHAPSLGSLSCRMANLHVQ